MERPRSSDYLVVNICLKVWGVPISLGKVMSSILENLLATALIGGVSVTGLAAVNEINTEVQNVVFTQQIEQAADCADLVFASYGVNPVAGVTAIQAFEATDMNRDLLNCMTPITGVTGEQLLQNPTDIYNIKEDL